MDFSESDEDLEFIYNIPVRKSRRFQTRQDFVAILDEKEFLRRFRLTKQSFQVILAMIRDKLSPQTNR